MVDDETHDPVDRDNLAKDDAALGKHMSTPEMYRGAYLMRFLVLIRGARTPPPRMDDPVTNIPLQTNRRLVDMGHEFVTKTLTHHPAPNTLNPMQRPTPVPAHAYGLDSSRNRPTLKASPEPANNRSQKKSSTLWARFDGPDL
jgi:hypothetical protein